MSARQALRDFRGRPEVAGLELIGVDEAAGPDEQRWFVQLAPDATVIELAMLMVGLGFKMTANHIRGDGTVRLFPVDPTSPPPTTEQIYRILSQGFPDPLPSLRHVPDDRPAKGGV